MAPKVVRYYFGFGSPFAALADARIDALVEEAAVGDARQAERPPCLPVERS